MGGKDNPPPSVIAIVHQHKEALTEIFAYSKGLPRDAVKLSDEILRHVFVQQLMQAGNEHVRNAAKELDLEK